MAIRYSCGMGHVVFLIFALYTITSNVSTCVLLSILILYRLMASTRPLNLSTCPAKPESSGHVLAIMHDTLHTSPRVGAFLQMDHEHVTELRFIAHKMPCKIDGAVLAQSMQLTSGTL
jgi:hypothetical protein